MKEGRHTVRSRSGGWAQSQGNLSKPVSWRQQKRFQGGKANTREAAGCRSKPGMPCSLQTWSKARAFRAHWFAFLTLGAVGAKP